MVMEISFSTMFFHDHPLDLIFHAMVQTGADTLEFWPETPDWWLSGLPMDRLSAVAAVYPSRTRLSYHAPVLDLNPCSINPDVGEISIQWIERSIQMAEQINAGVCTIHPGRRTSKRPPSDADYQRLNHMLDRIEPIAKQSKIAVSIENMEPQINALITSPAEIFEILDERKWLSFTLDVCHVSSQGISILSDFLDRTFDRIANIHLSGAEGSVMHLPSKNNRWAEDALEIVLDSGYNGLVTLEINDLSCAKSLSYSDKIRILAEDIEYIRESEKNDS